MKTPPNRCLLAADKDNLDNQFDLKEHCATVLVSQIQTTNALDLTVWAHLHSFEKIKDATLNCVAANGEVIFETN